MSKDQTSNPIVLKTKDLAIGYKSKKKEQLIIDNINISIHKGSLIVLLGKNGVGKSTLLRTLSKVQAPLHGNVYLQNKNIASYTNSELAKILSLVLTERLPISQLTVFELIALGRQPYTNWIDTLSDVDIKKIEEAINLTEIAHIRNKPFYELSDGQLQRVLIARALAQDTDIIILDEPTAHLDIHHTFKIFSLLKNLVQTTQKTILISTHEVNLALQLAEQFIVLANKQVYSGNADTLIAKDAFSSLFPKELIHFDKKTKQFVINQI